MKNHVTVIPVDSLIIVDGQALRFEFAAPKNLHALQWHNGKGHMEWLDDFNHTLSGEILYAEDVEPYVKLWEAEANRLKAEAKHREKEANRPPTQEELNEARRQEIIAALTVLDAESARPLRAIISGSGSQADNDKLAELEEKANALRAELAALPSIETPASSQNEPQSVTPQNGPISQEP